MKNKFLRCASSLMAAAYLTGCATLPSEGYSSKRTNDSGVYLGRTENPELCFEERSNREGEQRSGSRKVRDELLKGVVEALLSGGFF